MIEFRDFKATDTTWLTAVHNQLFPDDQRTNQSWHHLRHGRAWLMLVNEELVGYTAVLPVPGLPGLVEMEGFITPNWQRQGAGTRLLHHVQAQLTGTNVQQLSYAVSSLDTPAARFLQKHHFFIEHEEWLLTLSPLSHYSSTIDHAQLTFKTLPQSQAISLFQQLYRASFHNTPWDQPFSDAEIAHSLDDHNPITFLFERDTAVGFIWVRRQSDTAVMLEPIGIIKEKQGQGYGRYLLQTLLNQLKSAGISTVTIGVWANNATAVHLYRSLGFQKTSSLIYLAYNLPIS